MANFEIGAVVKLKSGGPRMTVKSITEDGKLDCVWFDEKKELKRGSFDQALVKVSNDPGLGFCFV